MISRLENVIRAVTMQEPDYVPIIYYNKDQELSDIIMIEVVSQFHYRGEWRSEWGFEWDSRDGTMGQPKEEIIKSWDDLDSFTPPDPYSPDRFSGVASEMARYGANRYYIASLALTGFTVMSFLRGFENTMIDLYEERDNIEKLADIVFGFEAEVIKQLKAYGFHAVAFFDDWGTQNSLLINADMWRELFKPRYAELFSLAHDNGLHVYFHCCGSIDAIIGDFIDAGVDMLNLSQPNLFDLEWLGREYGGKTCFVCPVSYQTTSITGTREDIFRDVERLVKNLGSKGGGLIGYLEEYRSIGLSDDNYRHCADAFSELGQYKREK